MAEWEGCGSQHWVIVDHTCTGSHRHLKEAHDVMPILRSLDPAQERLDTPLGSTSPNLFETVVWVLLHVRPTRTST